MTDTEKYHAYWEIERNRREQLNGEVERLERENATLREALRPFAAFGRYIEANPRKGLAEELYAWDGGASCGKPEASIRQADLRNAARVLAEQPASAQQGDSDVGS